MIAKPGARVHLTEEKGIESDFLTRQIMTLFRVVRPAQTSMPALTLSSFNEHTYRAPENRAYHTSRINLRSHYDVLGLTPKASPAQIKSAYYRLSKLYHPDVNKSEDAKKKFTAISEAYEVLANRTRRRVYDGTMHGSGAGMASAVRAKKVNAEYEEFSGRKGQFKARPGTPVTGKTAHFDFDEFYKQHYGQVLDETRHRREQQKKFSDEAKDIQAHHGRTPMHLLVITLVAGSALAVKEICEQW